MIRPDPPDVTNQPDRENILRIVAYLGALREGARGFVPGEILDALLGLLARAEVAEGQLAQLRSDLRQEHGQRGSRGPRSTETISYVCRICGQTVVRTQVVGAFRPSVCATSACQREARQQDARDRQRRFRQRQCEAERR